MVAKPLFVDMFLWSSLNLAKIHMVAKPNDDYFLLFQSLNLAKIHMVAKQCIWQ